MYLMIHAGRGVALLTLVVLTSVARIGFSNELIVSTDSGFGFNSIQSAIEASEPGDTVSVLAGAYFENIDFLGKDILVRGMGATIDGGRIGPCVSFHNGESRAAVLEGFVLTNGVSAFPRAGGGVSIRDASPTIRGNQVLFNQSSTVGGGIGMSVSVGYRLGPRIVDNVIMGNETENNGGGIGLLALGDCEVVGNTVQDNFAQLDGGGVWLFVGVGEYVIQGNAIVSNESRDHAGGLFVSINGAELEHHVLMTGNVIAGNVALLDSGLPPVGCGVYLSSVRGEFSNNTVVGNLGSGAVGVAIGLLATRYSLLASR